MYLLLKQYKSFLYFILYKGQMSRSPCIIIKYIGQMSRSPCIIIKYKGQMSRSPCIIIKFISLFQPEDYCNVYVLMKFLSEIKPE